MKKLLLALVYIITLINIDAQNAGYSAAYSFDIRKKFDPPILEYVGDVIFLDENDNNAIDANEKCAIEFTLLNTGKGDALNLITNLKATGNTDGIKFNNLTQVPPISKLNGKQTIKIEINSNGSTVNGVINFVVEVIEPNGFNTNAVNLQIITRKLLEPEVAVVDFRLFSENGTSNLILKKPFSLELLVQNLGQGIAKDVQLNLSIPENVFMTSEKSIYFIGNLLPGEKKSYVFDLILNAKYAFPTLKLSATLSESFGKYSKNWENTFALNQELAQQKIIVEAKPIQNVSIEQASLRSDVDKDIPLGLKINPKKYALIIGCEDYAKSQSGLDKEVNVEFAANDASVFAEYAKSTLGYPADQVYLLIDPTAAQIKQNLEKLTLAMEIEKGAAEILFYYSGHGLPDNETNEPYLIPVDVNGNNPQDGILLSEVYKRLSKNKSTRVTIVLDACFSGGARNKELVAMKGVKIKPKMDLIPGNLLVLTSSRGNESSAVYKEKQHGYFTYFLLKHLKETKGEITIGTMFDEINYKVSKEVLKISKTQNPDVMPGIEIFDSWKNLKW